MSCDSDIKYFFLAISGTLSTLPSRSSPKLIHQCPQRSNTSIISKCPQPKVAQGPSMPGASRASLGTVTSPRVFLIPRAMFLPTLEEFWGETDTLKFRSHQDLSLSFVFAALAGASSMSSGIAGSGDQSSWERSPGKPVVKGMLYHWEMNFNTHRFLICQVSLSTLSEEVRWYLWLCRVAFLRCLSMVICFPGV